MSGKKKADDVAGLLKSSYPEPKTELEFKNPYELACAVILSAMCTDKAVNKITPAFFRRFPTPGRLAEADSKEIKSCIKSINFFNNKAKSLSGMAKTLVAEFNGEIPRTMAELLRLPGIARKSANVILNEAFNLAEGFVVDTHVARVSNRLGLTNQKDPLKIEKDLMGVFDEKDWRLLSSAMVLHGRYVCTARKPKCSECVLNEVCPSAFKF
ncbi:endonuclease III [candidate division WWE3 bacterium]|nr:endonuclease III [candidate division WWE3 bacterium]